MSDGRLDAKRHCGAMVFFTTRVEEMSWPCCVCLWFFSVMVLLFPNMIFLVSLVRNKVRTLFQLVEAWLMFSVWVAWAKHTRMLQIIMIDDLGFFHTKFNWKRFFSVGFKQFAYRDVVGGKDNLHESKLTHLLYEDCAWIFTHAEVADQEYARRIHALLKLFYPGSPGAQFITHMYQRLEPLVSTKDNFNGHFVGQNAATLRVFETPIAEGTRHVPTGSKWQVFKSMMMKHINVTADTDEDKLNRLKRERDETWASFITRFYYVASTTTVIESMRTKILFRKVPRDLQQVMMGMDANSTLDQIVEKLRTVNYWKSMNEHPITSYGSAQNGDPMEIDATYEDVNSELIP